MPKSNKNLKARKRFIVTFEYEQISQADAAGVLQVEQKNFDDGVEFLMSESVFQPERVAHFETIGASLIELSDEYAEKLRPTGNGRASGRRGWILAGMGWVVQNDMDVASMSLGSVAGTADEPCILAYRRAAQRLINNGCIVISSAGNSGDDPTPTNPTNPWVSQPARCSGFMAVAAVDRDRNLAAFSSRGPSELGCSRRC